MPLPLVDILLALPLFAFVLFRIAGVMLTAPLLSSSVIPLRIRVALALALATMTFPMLARHAPDGLTLPLAITGAVGELAVGACIGLALSLVILCGDIAGMIVGQQGGLALGEVFDPMLGRDTTVTGQLYTIVLTLLFLAAGGHRETLRALLDSYQAVPMRSFALGEPVVLMLIEVMTASFVVAIRVAGPALIALFLMGTAMGFLSRTMPQFNILSVGFTMRVMVALGTAGLALSACRDMLLELIWHGLSVMRLALGIGMPA